MGKKRVVEQQGGEALASAKSSATKKSRKKLAGLTSTRVYIAASYNNTSISVTDSTGNLIVWSSAGSMGFKGPKKATPYAASRVVENIFDKLGTSDLGKVSVYVKGVGSGRDAAIRAFSGRGVNIVELSDITPVPHNGCRPRKARRV